MGVVPTVGFPTTGKGSFGELESTAEFIEINGVTALRIWLSVSRSATVPASVPDRGEDRLLSQGSATRALSAKTSDGARGSWPIPHNSDREHAA